MAITQDEHNELLAQIDELNEKLLEAEGVKEDADADAADAESRVEELQDKYNELENVSQDTVSGLQDLAKTLDRFV